MSPVVQAGAARNPTKENNFVTPVEWKKFHGASRI
jgi:hypothetical protein